MKYDNDQLAELCEKFDLLEYASNTREFVNQSGRWYTSCPLHVDKTPSLCVDTKTNRFYCFSCGCNGSPIDWMVKIEKMRFSDAVEKIARLTGSALKDLKQCDTLVFFKTIKKLNEKSKKVPIQREILSSEKYDCFSDEIPEEWVEEGISEEIIKKYEIRIDHKANRIVYPVYDNDGNLIGVKGRTRFKQYKELRIPKYMNYYPVGQVDYFMGEKQHLCNILKDKKVVIFEGIKSVMKSEQFGGKMSMLGLAAETSTINEIQVSLLIKWQVNEVILAFDKGVDLKKIAHCTEKLRKFTNVYLIYDRHDLLEDKDAPVDKGKEVWEQLLNERIRL